MTLQTRLNKIIIELEKLSKDCKYNGEKSDLKLLITLAKEIKLEK